MSDDDATHTSRAMPSSNADLSVWEAVVDDDIRLMLSDDADAEAGDRASLPSVDCCDAPEVQLPPASEPGPAFRRLTVVLKPETTWDYPRAQDDEDNSGDYCFTVVHLVHPASGQVLSTRLRLHDPWLERECARLTNSNISDAPPGYEYAMPQEPGPAREYYGYPRVGPKFIKFNPDVLFQYFVLLEGFLAELRAGDESESKTRQLESLLQFIRSEYTADFDELERLNAREEITFKFLGTLYLPGTVVLYHCSTTKEPRAARVISAIRQSSHWSIAVAYISAAGNASVDFAETTLLEVDFGGAVQVHSLSVHPLDANPRAAELHVQLVNRGKKWHALNGLHHMQYDGIAVAARECPSCDDAVGSGELYHYPTRDYLPSEIAINSRVMLDNGKCPSDKRLGSSVASLGLATGFTGGERNTLSDDELLLTSPILYGFCLVEKIWLYLNVENISEIKWNEEAFTRLVLPPAQKNLLVDLARSQVGKGHKFDDFIKGKGQGMILNLFGPPGVGKTMSVEAISEHLHRPLFKVWAGQLGGDPKTLEKDLTEIFERAARWGAVTLLDEADVYLARRSMHDLERNKLIAVFLRQLEYFPGLLFVTTNLVRTFDPAFLSRIHISLRFRPLTEDARRQIWLAFLSRADLNLERPLSIEEENILVSRQINGRQIRNAVRMASGLAAGRQEPVSFTNLLDVVEVIEQFEADLREPDEEPESL